MDESNVSDEVKIVQFSGTKTVCEKAPNQSYTPKYTIQTVKYSPSVMLWGCMSGRGWGAVWIMPKNTTMSAKVYLDVLKYKLEPMMSILDCDIFQQNGAPVHTARIVIKWLLDK